MVKRLNTEFSFLFLRDDSAYCVVLFGIGNDVNGNRRYEAFVSNVTAISENNRVGGASHYRFTGHCMGPQDEAQWILDHHIMEERKD